MSGEDELAHRRFGLAADEGVGITDVDCTPRPRYRESQEAFAKRMRGMWLEADGKTRIVARRNRTAALRTLENGLHATFCACGFRGLQVSDPEVARREYDAHVCAIAETGDVIHRRYRGPIDRRPASRLIPALAEERIKLGVALPGDEVVSVKLDADDEPVDDFAARVALLESK